MSGDNWTKALTFMVISLLALSPVRAEEAKGKGKGSAPASNYLGAEKCKTCHQPEKKGNQYKKWQESKHAKAFATLGSPEAKKLAKEKGIDDPQKSDKCLKCHVTAFGVPAEHLAKGFDPKLGVQCESCHGPGEKHFKARMVAAMKETAADKDKYRPIPADEIATLSMLKTCLTCHNEESPSFKDFCMKKRYAEIGHLDPRKSRTPEQLAAMKCGCGDKCTCKKGECGDVEGASAEAGGAKEAGGKKDAKG